MGNPLSDLWDLTYSSTYPDFIIKAVLHPGILLDTLRLKPIFSGSDNDMVDFSLSADIKLEVDNTGPEPSQYIEIPEGWCMVSLPLITSSKALSDIFPGAVVAYGYEKSVGYKRVVELEPGNGYWLLVDKDQSYVLNGEPFETYSCTVDEDGWKMIGGCTYEALLFTENCDISVIYGYEQGKGYQRILETESLMPGRAYWVLFNEVIDFCELIVWATDF